MPTPPIDPSEVLYRQVGPGSNPIYFEPERQPPVHPSLFIPSPSDFDGLSLIRAKFRATIWAAHRAEKPDVRYRLAAVDAHAMQAIACQNGFTALNFESTEDALDHEHGEPWAHAVAVEINRADYDANLEAKKRIKTWARAVATAVTASQVLGPFDAPEGHPYRPAELPS